MTRVYTLYRVSSAGQVDHDDIPMQRIACQEFAKTQPDWEIIKEFYEKGVSGYKVSADDRDAIIQIKNDAAARKFDVLLVFMFDRLGRKDNETPFVVKYLSSQGIRVISVKEGEQRFETPVDDLLNYIRFWQASGESAKTSMRVRTRQQQITLEGHYRGGLVPFGFDAVDLGRVNKKNKPVRDLRINPEEAAIKAKIYHMIVDEGYGSHRIANWLNEHGIKTKRGTTLWRDTTVRAMIGNPIDRGQLHMGDTLSEPIEELRIIDDYHFYKAVDLIHSRSNEKREQVGLPLRTDAGGLLTGFIYCAACGQRLCINHCRTGKRGPENRVYQWDVYRCYRKVNSKNSCSGQTTYRANQVEKAVVEVVREFFSRVKRLPEGKQLEAAMGREKAVHQKALKDAQAVVEKTSKAVTALEEEVVKALTGESKLDLAIVNQLMNKKKAELDAATQEYDHILQIIADEGQRLQEKAEKLRELQHWADIFDKATRETQHMIIAGLVERVDVGKGYDIRIKLRISATQFFNPDKEPEGIEQAS